MQYPLSSRSICLLTCTQKSENLSSYCCAVVQNVLHLLSSHNTPQETLPTPASMYEQEVENLSCWFPTIPKVELYGVMEAFQVSSAV